MSFKRISFFNQVPRYACQWNLESPGPCSIDLSGASADIEIDKARLRRSLDKRTQEVWLSVLVFSYTNVKLKSQIAGFDLCF